ncbi:MAG: squalene/phytoene synthase family protein [Rubellimicrobium sp.]|nr:squalene/phytoene synthase family protein [Rubellimicrobium sp.]
MTVTDCARIVERGDPDRFLATMAAPLPARDVLWPLFAFNVEIARAPWRSDEPLVVEMRLQWWRDLIEEAGTRPPPAHEVAGPLAELVAARALPRDVLDRVIAARLRDTRHAIFEDEDEFRTHLDESAGGLLWATAVGLGADDALEDAVRRAGRAGGLAGWLMAVPYYVEHGKLPLADGRPETVARLARAALDDLAALRRVRFGPALPAMRTLWQARRVLRQVVADPAAVGEGRLGLTEFARRATLFRVAATGRWLA